MDNGKLYSWYNRKLAIRDTKRIEGSPGMCCYAVRPPWLSHNNFAMIPLLDRCSGHSAYTWHGTFMLLFRVRIAIRDVCINTHACSNYSKLMVNFSIRNVYEDGVDTMCSAMTVTAFMTVLVS